MKIKWKFCSKRNNYDDDDDWEFEPKKKTHWKKKDNRKRIMSGVCVFEFTQNLSHTFIYLYGWW